MTWSIDHIALVAHDLGTSLRFYAEVLGAEGDPIAFTPHPNVPNRPRAILLDRVGSSIHLIEPLPNFHCEWPTIPVNPTSPHVAITVPDSQAVIDRLEAIEWRYLAPQNWGPAGYSRLYTNDPSMNTVEASQVVKADEATTGLARVRGVEGSEPLNDAAWTLDHVYLSSFDLDRSRTWYGTFIGVEPPTPDGPGSNGEQPFATERSIVFAEEGLGRGITVAQPSSRSTAGIWVDTVAHSCFGVTTGDLDGVAHRLERAGIAFAELGDALYFRDPSMNVVRATADAA